MSDNEWVKYKEMTPEAIRASAVANCDGAIRNEHRFRRFWAGWLLVIVSLIVWSAFESRWFFTLVYVPFVALGVVRLLITYQRERWWCQQRHVWDEWSDGVP